MSLVCNIDQWLGGRVLALQSLVMVLSSSPYCIQVMLNQLVMVIARPINLNVSCKLHPSSLQRTRSSPGPGPPKRVGNMHTCNYYDLKGKDIDVTCV